MKHLKYYDLTTAIISLCSSIFFLSLTYLFLSVSKSDSSIFLMLFPLVFLYLAFWWAKRFIFEFKPYYLYRLNKYNTLISQAKVRERYTIIRRESRKTSIKKMYIIIELENGLLLKFYINRNKWEKLTTYTLLNITYLKEPEVIISLKINNTIKNNNTQDITAWVVKYNVIGTNSK